MKGFIAGENDENIRLSRFISRVTHGLPVSLLHKYFRLGRIKVNGKKAKADHRLKKGDEISVYLNDEFFATPATPPNPPSNGTPPPILWQNKDLAFIYKPSGLRCHSPAAGQPSLLGNFTAALVQNGEFSPELENQFSPALCNRLDQGTEGIVIAAKNYTTLRAMNEIIKLKQIEKHYLCIVQGKPPEGMHTAYWKNDQNENLVYITANETEGSKKIQTKVQVLQTRHNFSLCNILLVTGRKHQIRSHLQFLGHPIVGDRKYGNALVNKRTQAKTQALCAVSVYFSGIPETSSLAYLNGKKIEIANPDIEKMFLALTSQ
ncbi:RluA family pseudouridine synthase [Ruminococcaceae bacterium OttesenSCG-928-N02]|nr:RluA family pseudouridine synthase [Ruminococcaceae bacterium OttesenSCG-928-N02]